MKDMLLMNLPMRRNKLTRIGVTTLAAAVIATASTAMTAGSASAASLASAAAAKSAAPAAATAVVRTTAPARYTPPRRTLREGMRGADVRALQRRLRALRYYPGPIDGKFGNDTIEAVWAFQAVNRVKMSGVVNRATKRALVHPRRYKSHDPRQNPTRVEVNLAKRVLILYKHNKIRLISHVSTGGGYTYACSSGTCTAITPTGHYRTTVFMPGWVPVPLGAMYNPVFFISTVFAIHGDTAVPVYPASHGCVRLPMDIASFFHKLIRTPGTNVFIYKG